MSQEDQIGKLRVLLSAPKSKEAWQTIWDEVQGWPKYKNNAVALDYLEQHLQQWPDELRILPHDKLSDWQRNKSNHMFAFVRGLYFGRSSNHYEHRENQWQIFHSPLAPSITHLHSEHSTYYHAHMLECLAKSPIQLRSLSLPNGMLGPDTLAQTFISSALQHVKQLFLPWNGIGLDGCRVIVEAIPGLTLLDLSYNHIHARGVYTLLESHHMETLRTLKLSHNRIAGQRLSSSSPVVQQLRHLDLSFNGINGRSIERLLTTGAFTTLKELDLTGNPIGHQRAAHIAAALPQQLRTLHLRCADLGDKGVLAFVDQLPTTSALSTLDISFNHISHNTRQALLEHPSLQGVDIIDAPDAPNAARTTDASEPLQLRSAGFSHSEFASSEDAYGISSKRGICVVVDGLGRGGGVVPGLSLARTITDQIDHEIPAAPDTISPEEESSSGTKRLSAQLNRFARRFQQQESFFHQVLRQTHILSYEMIHAQYYESRRMAYNHKCTCAALLLREDHALLASIGDVLIYRWRDQKLTQLNEDQSSIARLRVQEPSLTPEQLAEDPRRYEPTPSLTTKLDIALSYQRVPIAPMDIFLMCTDGIHKHMTQAHLQTLLGRLIPPNEPISQAMAERIYQTIQRDDIAASARAYDNSLYDATIVLLQCVPKDAV